MVQREKGRSGCAHNHTLAGSIVTAGLSPVPGSRDRAVADIVSYRETESDIQRPSGTAQLAIAVAVAISYYAVGVSMGS
jgi:hypothetical protein